MPVLLHHKGFTFFCSDKLKEPLINMASLSDKQWIFLQNVCKLIDFAYATGYKLTGGELFRPKEMQEIYVQQGKSKTLEGQHGKRMAIDLNLFIDGVYRTDREAYKVLAEYWKTLHPDNVAGYDWGWDANHFEMKG